MPTCAFIIIIIFIFKSFLAVFSSVFVYLFPEHFFIEQCFLLRQSMLHFTIVCSGFYMSSIYKYSSRINKLEAVAVFKNTLEYLLKEVCVLETSCIVLSKC